jgi:hypothetical protein
MTTAHPDPPSDDPPVPKWSTIPCARRDGLGA